MTEEFVLTISEHRKFGKFLTAHSILISNTERYPITNIITKTQKQTIELNSDEKELIRLIDEYSNKNIARIFSKKKQPSKIFIDSLTEDFLISHIRPFIERRIVKCLGIASKSNIRIYYKNNPKNIYEDDNINLFATPAEAIFNFEKTKDGTNYSLTLKQGNHEINLTNQEADILTTDPCNLILHKKLFSFKKIDAKKLLPFFTRKYITIKKEAEQKYYESFVLNAIKNHTVNASGFEIINLKPEKKAILSLEKNLKSNTILLLKFKYGDEKTFLANENNKVFIKFKSKENYFSFDKIVRDFIWEQECITKLETLGLIKDTECNFKIHDNSNDIENSQHNFINWININKPALENEGFILIQEFLNKKYFTQNIHLDINLKEKNDWFDIYANVHFGEYIFPFIRLRNYILNNIREFKLPNGEIAILPEEWFAEYKDLFLFCKENMENFLIRKHHFQIIKNKQIGIDPSFRNGFTALSETKTKKYLLPENIKARLRSYQETGYNWLYNLQTLNFGGCLADDMGLGKTLQALTLLQQLINEKKNLTDNDHIIKDESLQLNIFDAINELEKDFCKPQKQAAASLIIMPVSLIHNWYNEIKKFAPNLTVLVYTGQERKKFPPSSFYNYDIILTSYGIVRNDFEILATYQYFYIILDESQYIKNPESKIYKAVISLDSSHRFVLTGTPIENSLTDLWAQLNFLNEGLLGNLSFFKTEFVTPIEKNNDEVQQRKLQNLIQPFILRRTKDEVASELPPLTSQEIYCEMTEEQYSFYENEKSRIRNAVLNSIEDGKSENISFMILQGLTKLRQAANHPELICKDYEYESGKFIEIVRNVENLLAQKHKVLIFSSFVKYLKLIEKICKKKCWKYSMLTGKTTKRENIINDFQNDENNHLFLISLKAGGVGLNLTSADYVFILDPWWNPAVENQAINRAHRIGQDKRVFVYRFITRKSIEEKIQQLQQRKSDLANTFVNSNTPFKELDKEALLELFE